VVVKGTYHNQDVLAAASGGKRAGRHEHKCQAVLVADPTNPHDPNAVAVYVENLIVGFLARMEAEKYRSAMATLTARGLHLRCQARIVGGWDNGNGDEGYFGVRLNLPSPAQLEDALAKVTGFIGLAGPS
jgi:hypothetical protein